jgi:hypothetical protein
MADSEAEVGQVSVAVSFLTVARTLLERADQTPGEPVAAAVDILVVAVVATTEVV